jgi:RNA polymerase sigma-70 factor, ECF subfamily
VGRWGRLGSGAATRPLHGRRAVAQFVLASTRYLPSDNRTEIAEVNGQPAAIVYTGQRILLLIALDVDHNQVCRIRVIGNPEKLRGL